MNRRRALMATQNGGEKPILNPSIGYTENYKIATQVGTPPYLTTKQGCAVTDFFDAGTSGTLAYFNPNTPSLRETDNKYCGHILTFSSNSDSASYTDWWNCRMNGEAATITLKSNKRYVRLNIPLENLSGVYAYNSTTGKIYYAGKDTPYYGHTNISEVSA